jgi:hypothetical protein
MLSKADFRFVLHEGLLRKEFCQDPGILGQDAGNLRIIFEIILFRVIIEIEYCGALICCKDLPGSWPGILASLYVEAPRDERVIESTAFEDLQLLCVSTRISLHVYRWEALLGMMHPQKAVTLAWNGPELQQMYGFLLQSS